MKATLRIISIISLLTITTPSYSFIISCRSLLHAQSGNRILILGESYALDTPFEHNVNSFLLGLEKLEKEVTEPVNCFVELAAHHIERTEILSETTFKVLAREIAQPTLFTRNVINLIPSDRRGKISDYVTSLLRLIHKNSASLVTPDLYPVFKSPISLRAYYKMIARHREYIEWQQRIFKEPIASTILEPLKKSIIDAQLRLKKTVFQGEKETSNLYKTIIKYISNKSKGNLLKENTLINMHKEEGLWSDFINSIDYAFAHASFFCDVVRDQQEARTTPKLTLLIVSEMNAKAIMPLFSQIGYSLVEEQSCLPIERKSELKHKESITDVPKMLHLLIYYSPLLSHPATEEKTREAYIKAREEYKRVSEKIREKNKRIHTQASALCVKQAIALLTPKDGISPSDILLCHNPSCTNHDTNVTLKHCGRCKRVSYCSALCQKTDWTTHKIVCKQK